jgi:hypothetical protein
MLVSALLLSSLAPAARAEESLNVTGKRVKIVAKSALYGFGGGLVVGLASQVFKKKVKNIFMFGSLGLYAGIALGLYVVSTSGGPLPYEGPDTYDDFSWNRSLKPLELARAERKKSDLQLQLVEVKF